MTLIVICDSAVLIFNYDTGELIRHVKLEINGITFEYFTKVEYNLHGIIISARRDSKSSLFFSHDLEHWIEFDGKEYEFSNSRLVIYDGTIKVYDFDP